MCLYVENNERRRVADRNILVYKKVLADGSSGYMGFKYKEGRTYSNPNIVKKNGTVEEAFHAFTTLNAAKVSNYTGNVVAAVIPKGAMYYIGLSNQIASNKMKVVSLDPIR